MKVFLISAAALAMSILTVPPAAAQKDPACMEKCNRDNPRDAGLHQQQRATAVRNCVQACPRSHVGRETLGCPAASPILFGLTPNRRRWHLKAVETSISVQAKRSPPLPLFRP